MVIRAQTQLKNNNLAIMEKYCQTANFAPRYILEEVCKKQVE